jgi:hypothetical protein
MLIYKHKSIKSKSNQIFQFDRDTCSYSELQEDVKDVFTSVQNLISSPDYFKHVREEAYMEKMIDIDEQLISRKNDLMKSDCSVLVAGKKF